MTQHEDAIHEDAVELVTRTNENLNRLANVVEHLTEAFDTDRQFRRVVTAALCAALLTVVILSGYTLNRVLTETTRSCQARNESKTHLYAGVEAVLDSILSESDDPELRPQITRAVNAMKRELPLEVC